MFEGTEDMEIKELCLGVYVRMAVDKDNKVMNIVLDSDLIYDILSLEVKTACNYGVIRNMLILVQLMILSKNDKAMQQMKGFDLVQLLLHIMIEAPDTMGALSYLSLGCLGLLVMRDEYRKTVALKNKEHSVLNTIIQVLKRLKPKDDQIVFRYFLRSIHLYLLAFDKIDETHLETDMIITLISSIHTIYD